MSDANRREQELRMNWLEKQMQKIDFDMTMELRKLKRQTWGIALTAIGLVVGAFAAGAAWMNYFWQHR